MTYFNEDFITFFAGLALNNEKSWMDMHRKDYIENVKKPWDAFLQQLISEVRRFSDIDQLPLSKFQFRINRDVRFSHDKTPYTTWVSAVLSKSGKKDLGPVYYLRLGLEGVQLGGGVYKPPKDALRAIRKHIMHDPQKLHNLLEAKPFIDYWSSELRGEKNKMIPKEFKLAAKNEQLLFHKDFTFWKEFGVDKIISEGLLSDVADHFNAAKEVNKYFKDAMGI